MMLIDGKKWACATCVKGHRATQCNHHDRPLVEIKKKGRPATQCVRCRELRTVRQLHVKCDCNDLQAARSKRKSNAARVHKQPLPDHLHKANLRSIAPKPVLPTVLLETPPLTDGMQLGKDTVPLPSAESPGKTVSACCRSQSATPVTVTLPTPSPPLTPASGDENCCGANTTSTATSNSIGASCCSSEKVSAEGKRIRVITCRCGDSCACPGCDAHPSRAMKSKSDPYAGFDVAPCDTRRRLSIAAICDPSDSSSAKIALTITEEEQQHPTSILSSDDTLLCGCGCAQLFESCSGCFRELCSDYNSS